MSRHNSRMGSFSPTQRRACIVLVLCVLAVILSAVFSWVLLPGLLGRGGGRTGDYDPDQYPVDTTLGSVLPASAADGSYLSSTVFVGGPYTDSLYTTGQITLDQYLGADGLTIGDILQRSCISFAQDSNTYTVPQALAKMKPRRAIITLGGADLDGATVDSFIMDYRNVLRSLSTAYSYCDLIVNALPPVAETSEGAAARQTLIDQINQQLAIVCNEDGYKFLNSAEVLKADTGFADPTYFEGNGYNASGARTVLDYAAAHAWQSDDRRPDTNDIPVRAQQPAAAPTAGPTPSATPGKFTASYEVEDPDTGSLKSGDKSGVSELSFEDVEPGEPISVTAVPAEGYEFYQWSDNQTSATRYDIVTRDISVTAMFNKKVTVVLTINEGDQNIRLGESVVFHSTLKVDDKDGNTDNVQWAVNGDLVRNGYSFEFKPEAEGTYTIRAGIEIEGVYASQEVTVTVEKPATSISISGSDSIRAGESVTLTAKVENGSGDTTWSCEQLPGWSATGSTAQFSADSVGRYYIKATNNGASSEFELNVEAAPTPEPDRGDEHKDDKDDEEN